MESLEKDRGIPHHGTAGEGHIAFAASPSSIPKWKDHFEKLGVELETEVQWKAGSHSLYLRDPAGNSVELAPPSLWGGI